MKKHNGRRSFLQTTAGLLGAGFWADETLDALPQNTNTNSKPSALSITDMRVLTIARAPMTCPIIRIDTNQGIYGLGEVRDGASKNYALMLKSRMLSENPCNVDKIFRKIKQFGGHCAAGRRRLRRRDGAVGSGGQGVQRPGLPDARRQVPRPHPLLCRHDGRPRSRRSTASA